MTRGKLVVRGVLATVAIVGVAAPSAPDGPLFSQAARAQGAFPSVQDAARPDQAGGQVPGGMRTRTAQAVPQNPPLRLALGHPVAIPHGGGSIAPPIHLVPGEGPLALPSLAPRAPGGRARGAQAQGGPTTYEVPTAGCSGVAGAVAMPSIQSALAAANSGDTIDLCAAGSPYGVVSSPGYYAVSQDNLTIQGVGGTVVIDAGRGTQQPYGFIVIGSGDTFSNLTIRNAIQTGGVGGAALALRGGPATLNNLTLTNNDIAVYVAGGRATLNAVTESSTSARNLAGLLVSAGVATVNSGCSFSGNTGNALANGVLLINGGTLTATGARFDGNQSAGIRQQPAGTATISLTGSDVSNNGGGQGGSGVIMLGNGRLTSSGTTFNNDGAAGVVIADATRSDATTTVSLSGGTANNNTFTGAGFGVEVAAANPTAIDIAGMSITGNTIGVVYQGPGAVSPLANGLTNDSIGGNRQWGFAALAPGNVRSSGSTFNGNGLGGSRFGGILIGPGVTGTTALTSVQASSNTGDGLTYQSPGALTISTGAFNANTGTNAIGLAGAGIDVEGTDAPATLSGVTANGNAGAGLADESNGLQTLATDTFSGNGASGALFTPLTPGSHGVNTSVVFSALTARSDGRDGLTYNERGTGSITGIGNSTGAQTSFFDANPVDGVTITGGGSGAVSLTGAEASKNTYEGLNYQNNGRLSVTNGAFGPAGSGNTQAGIIVGGTFSSVSVVGSTVDGDGREGLIVVGNSSGAISVTGGGDYSGDGTVLANSGIFVDTGQANPITIGDAAHTITVKGNGEDGVTLYSDGADTITNVISSGNGTNLSMGGVNADGLFDGGAGSLAVSNSTFTGNADNGVEIGLPFQPPGTIGSVTLTNVVADGNGTAGIPVPGGSDGLQISKLATGGVTLNQDSFDNNVNDGIRDRAVGALAIRGASAGARTTLDGNGHDGLQVGEPSNSAAVQVPVTMNFVEANGNTGAATGFGAGVELDNRDAITATNSAFDNNAIAGVALFTRNVAAGVSDSFDRDDFSGNANGQTSGSAIDKAGLTTDHSDTLTISVTNSTLTNNGNGPAGGSGLYDNPCNACSGITETLTLQGDTIRGNDTAQALNAGAGHNGGGISFNSSGRTVSTPSPSAGSPANHITGNGVGIVITSDFASTPVVGGSLAGNDLTGNARAALEILPGSRTTNLSGLTFTGNALYGGPLDAVPTGQPGAPGPNGTLSKATRPAVQPSYGYANFDAANGGLDLSGNWLGIAGVAPDYLAGYQLGGGSNAPSATQNPNTQGAAPPTVPAAYTDIGGNWRLAGSVDALRLGPIPPTSLAGGQQASLAVSATLGDGAGHTIFDGQHATFSIFNGATLLTSQSATFSGGSAGATLRFVAPPPSGGAPLPLQVVVTAADRGVSDNASSVSVVPNGCQAVTWTNLVNVTANGGTLQRNGSPQGWTAGATGAATLSSGNGSVQVTADATTTGRMFGLTHAESSPSYTDITYALELQSDGTLDVYELGQWRAGPGTYSVGDVLKVAVQNGVVSYYRNGTLLYTNRVAPSYPLQADASLRDPNAVLSNAIFCGS